MSVDEFTIIDAVAINHEEIRKFTHEDEFMELSVRLLVEASSYVSIALARWANLPHGTATMLP
jgi:hypothetical protein